MDDAGATGDQASVEVVVVGERSPADEGDGAAWGVRWCHGPIVDLVDDPDFAGLPAGN